MTQETETFLQSFSARCDQLRSQAKTLGSEITNIESYINNRITDGFINLTKCWSALSNLQVLEKDAFEKNDKTNLLNKGELRQICENVYDNSVQFSFQVFYDEFKPSNQKIDEFASQVFLKSTELMLKYHDCFCLMVGSSGEVFWNSIEEEIHRVKNEKSSLGGEEVGDEL